MVKTGAGMNVPSKGLVAIVGAVAASGLMLLVPAQEGTVNKTYRDIGGVLTYCTGATENAIWGKTYTNEECKAQLDKDLARHAEGVMACVHVPLTDGQKIAFVDAAYRVGVAGFCSSSMAEKANAGDMLGACNALLLYDGINKLVKQPDGTKKKVHIIVPGIAKRAKIERELCLKK